MAQAIFTPQFSEFSFGYAVTERLTSYMGRPNWAPYFPTTNEEKELGFDVALASGAQVFLLQFKRSDAIVGGHGNLKELGFGCIRPPPGGVRENYVEIMKPENLCFSGG